MGALEDGMHPLERADLSKWTIEWWFPVNILCSFGDDPTKLIYVKNRSIAEALYKQIEESGKVSPGTFLPPQSTMILVDPSGIKGYRIKSDSCVALADELTIQSGT